MKFNRGLHTFSVLTAAATFFLIVAGGLVTSHDAGLSVPDWPLSFGQVMPEMVGGVFWEHGHRMVATTVGLLTIILCAWLWRSDPRGWMRRLGVAALVVVVLQGVLGGVTVLFQLPVAISVLHACLAQAFFCITVSIAVFTSRSWIQGSGSPSRFQGVRFSFAAAATTTVYLQLILGALLRHSGTVDGSKAVELVLPALAAHLAGALLVTGVLILLAIRLFWSDHRSTQRWGYLVMSLLVIQLMLGVGAYLARIDALGGAGALPRVAVATGHVAAGALLLAATLVLTLQLAGLGSRVARAVPGSRLAEEAS